MIEKRIRMVHYQGVKSLQSDVEQAIAYLTSAISVKVHRHPKHSHLEIGGIDRAEDTVAAIAVYLVGAVASCIEAHLSIRAALINESTGARDLLADVVKLIGADNSISKEFREKTRDPWVWEGISHLLFHLSRGLPELHPPEKMQVKTAIKMDVHDHGLDVLALYGESTLGLSAGECKAYLGNMTRGITDAANKLAEIDAKKRDSEIRAAAVQLGASLAPEQRDLLKNAFWKQERAYFPLVCSGAPCEVDFKRSRKVLTDLSPPPEKRVLVPLVLEQAKAFFNEVSDAMRAYCVRP